MSNNDRDDKAKARINERINPTLIPSKQAINERKQKERHDKSPATKGEINEACTLVYRILLNMMKALNDDQKQVLGSLNEVRSKLGLEPLSLEFEEPQGADTGKDTNEPTS